MFCCRQRTPCQRSSLRRLRLRGLLGVRRRKSSCRLKLRARLLSRRPRTSPRRTRRLRYRQQSWIAPLEPSRRSHPARGGGEALSRARLVRAASRSTLAPILRPAPPAPPARRLAPVPAPVAPRVRPPPRRPCAVATRAHGGDARRRPGGGWARTRRGSLAARSVRTIARTAQTAQTRAVGASAPGARAAPTAAGEATARAGPAGCPAGPRRARREGGREGLLREDAGGRAASPRPAEAPGPSVVGYSAAC